MAPQLGRADGRRRRGLTGIDQDSRRRALEVGAVLAGGGAVHPDVLDALAADDQTVTVDE